MNKILSYLTLYLAANFLLLNITKKLVFCSVLVSAAEFSQGEQCDKNADQFRCRPGAPESRSAEQSRQAKETAGQHDEGPDERQQSRDDTVAESRKQTRAKNVDPG